MKAKLFMARLLVMVMLLNSVLPAYAAVDGTGQTATETTIEAASPSNAILAVAEESDATGVVDYWVEVVTGGTWSEENGEFIYTKDGARVFDKLVETDGDISYVDEDGYMVTGLCELNGETYYFNEEGFMVFGTTVRDGGDYYTFNEDGVLVENPPFYIRKHPSHQSGIPGTKVTFRVDLKIDGEENPEIQWQCKYEGSDGWQNIFDEIDDTLTIEVTEENKDHRFRCIVSGEGLRLHTSSARIKNTGWVGYADGSFQYVIEGVAQTGWHTDDGGTFYLGEDGYMVTGLQKIDGVKYYFAPVDDGAHVLGQMWTSGIIEIDGVNYEAAENGALTETEKEAYPVPVVEGTWEKTADGWQCLDANGEYYEDVFALSDDGNIYFLGSDGYMVMNEFVEYMIGEKSHLYYLKDDGILAVNHWTSFVDEDGEEAYWRYLKGNGRAAKSEVKVIGQETYAFDNDAIMMTGWVNVVDGDPEYADDWTTAEYYYSESDNMKERGIRAKGLTAIKVDENEEYTFYFMADGKKKVNTENYEIDGVRYNIDEKGIVTLAEGGNTGEGSSPGEGDDLEPYEFVTMDQLKALVEAEDYERLVYAGEADFTVTEDFTLPKDINLDFYDCGLVVDDGVSVTVNRDAWINCDGLVVDGTMTTYSWINVGSSLDVNGTLKCEDTNIAVTYPATIKGIENIEFSDADSRNPWLQVTIEARFETMDALEAMLKAIPEDRYWGQDRIGFSLDYMGSPVDFVIDRDLEIPTDTEVGMYNVSTVTIANDCTVTNNGELRVNRPFTVKGELANHGELSVVKDERWTGTLSLADGGVYSGNGEFTVSTLDTTTELNTVLFGFDLNSMFFEPYHDEENGRIHWHFDTEGRSFNTFEGLVALLESDSSDRELRYVGTEPLVIKEDLTIPANISIGMRDQDLKVPAGVTFTTTSEVYNSKNIIVEGTWNAEAWIFAEESVTVSGTLNANQGLNAGSKLEIKDTGALNVAENTVQISYPCELIGLERIHFSDEWQNIMVEAEFEDMSELTSLAATLSTDYIKHDRVKYMIRMPWNNEDGPAKVLNITGNITVPQHVEMQMQGNRQYVIEEGATLTLDGLLYISAPLTLNGTIVNNSNLTVSNISEWDDNGTITFGANGKLEGKGDFNINADRNASGLGDVLFGTSLNNYEISRENIDDRGNKHWNVKYVGGLKKLGTPVNLQWGTEYELKWQYNETLDDYEFVSVGTPVKGSMSWDVTQPEQAEYQVYVYRKGESRPCAQMHYGFGEEYEVQSRSVDLFQIADLPSGTYYFTAQSVGDYVEYSNSDVATSGYYEYVKPSKKLDGCTNLKWVDKNDIYVTWMDWTEPADTEYLDGYEIEVWFSKTADGDFENFGGMKGRHNLESEDALHDHFFQNKGAGYYKFQVRALSSNIEECCNGDWSDLSPVFDLTKTPEDVKDDLDDIINNVVNDPTLTPDQVEEKVKEEVQKMDTQDLKTALLVDEDKSGATQKLADLEAKAGGAAPIEVTQDAAAFNPADVSIVGANLNNKAQDAAEEPIKLVVDKPEKEHVIEELYNSSVAVKFSMTLENVENPKELEVPVKITLPVPDSINPHFLVIFHYNTEGGHEIIWPHVYLEGNKWYADFVLTSFSDFVMTTMHDLEKVEAKPATYTSEGNIEHYICNCCGELFADAEAKQALKPEDVVIPKRTYDSSSDDDDEVSVSSKKPAASAALLDYVVSGQWNVADGKWTFADANGEVYKNKWAAVENPYANAAEGQAAFDWFFFDANGQMMTGWVLDGGRWYYLNPASDGTQGRMMTGWQFIDGKWYYLNPVSDGTKGAMVVDTWIGTYYVDVNGVWDATKTK